MDFVFAGAGDAASAGGSVTDAVKHTIVLVVLFVGLTLTLGRWLFDKILPFLQAHYHVAGRGAGISSSR